MEEQQDNKVPAPEKPLSRQGPNMGTLAMFVIFVAIVLFLVYNGREAKQSRITYGLFREQLAADNIAEVEVQGVKVTGEFKEPPIDREAVKKAAEKKAEKTAKEEKKKK